MPKLSIKMISMMITALNVERKDNSTAVINVSAHFTRPVSTPRDSVRCGHANTAVIITYASLA